MGKERKLYRVLVEKPEGKIRLGRPRCRWEDRIRMDPKERGWRCVCVWSQFTSLRIGIGGGLW
jgi:hypothetical protein